MTNWLIVGLGNPGRQYEDNRHNIGFMAVDALADQYGSGAAKSAFKSVIRAGSIDGENIIFQKPQTYMNVSGEAVGLCSRFYKIPLENIIVLHDELDIDAGTIRIKQGGGAGGHNGLKSIDHLVGNNYWRIRIGIGHPGDKNFVSSYVLNDFTHDEREWVDPLLTKLADQFSLMLRGQSGKLQSQINPPKEKKPSKSTEND